MLEKVFDEKIIIDKLVISELMGSNLNLQMGSLSKNIVVYRTSLFFNGENGGVKYTIGKKKEKGKI